MVLQYWFPDGKCIHLSIGILSLSVIAIGSQIGPIHGRQGKTEEKGRPLQTGRVGLTSKGTYIQILSLAASGSLHLSARILKVYIETLMGFSHIFSPDGLNNTLLFQGCILETALVMRTVCRMYIPRMGWESGASDCLAPVCGSAGVHISCWSPSIWPS